MSKEPTDLVARLEAVRCEGIDVLCHEAADEIERLRQRLEWTPEHPYDGIACRDETIRQQDREIERLRKALADIADRAGDPWPNAVAECQEITRIATDAL